MFFSCHNLQGPFKNSASWQALFESSFRCKISRLLSCLNPDSDFAWMCSGKTPAPEETLELLGQLCKDLTVSQRGDVLASFRLGEHFADTSITYPICVYHVLSLTLAPLQPSILTASSTIGLMLRTVGSLSLDEMTVLNCSLKVAVMPLYSKKQHWISCKLSTCGAYI